MVLGHPDFDALHSVLPGRHYYQFYKTRDDYLRVILPYFQAGLGKKEACLWLVSEKMDLESIFEIVARFLPDFGRYLENKQLHIRSAEAWYLKNGRFDKETAYRNAAQLFGQVKELGYTHFRGAGDVGAVPHEDWPSIKHYEMEIGGWIHSSQTIALCSYPILECTLSETQSILDLHDHVLVAGAR